MRIHVALLEHAHDQLHDAKVGGRVRLQQPYDDLFIGEARVSLAEIIAARERAVVAAQVRLVDQVLFDRVQAVRDRARAIVQSTTEERPVFEHAGPVAVCARSPHHERSP